jgi:uncharacterized RDD family membrane protein YckC
MNPDDPDRPEDTPPPPGRGSYGTGPVGPPPPSGGWQQPGAMPPPVPGSYGTPGTGAPGGLGPRFLARLVDYLLLGVVNGVLVSFLVVGVLLGSDAGSLTGWGVGEGVSWTTSAVSSVVTGGITLGYFTLMEANRGQTVGKMLLKLETRGPAGGRPTTEQALRRNLFTVIGVLGIIPFLGFLAGLLSLAAVIMIAVTISNNRETRRGWHDDFAGGTTVVKVG